MLLDSDHAVSRLGVADPRRRSRSERGPEPAGPRPKSRSSTKPRGCFVASVLFGDGERNDRALRDAVERRAVALPSAESPALSPPSGSPLPGSR